MRLPWWPSDGREMAAAVMMVVAVVVPVQAQSGDEGCCCCCCPVPDYAAGDVDDEDVGRNVATTATTDDG